MKSETSHGPKAAEITNGAPTVGAMVKTNITVEDTEDEERAHQTCQSLAITTVELGEGGEDKGKRHVLGEVLVGTRGEIELVLAEGFRCYFLGRRVSKTLVLLHSASDDA